MGVLTPKLTNLGTEMMLKSLNGDGITFTRIVIGDGNEPEDDTGMTALGSQRVSVSITGYETQANYVIVTGRFNNSGITSGFRMTELGLCGFNESDNIEHLYAYRYAAPADVDFVPAISSGRVVETEISVIVSVGTSSNISAIISEGTGYANAADLLAHTEDRQNPHHVTKEQLDLGNVPNLAPSDMTITYTAGTDLEDLEPGETIAAAFAKVAGLISRLKAHLTASNPHGITCAKIGAALSTHTHTPVSIGAAAASHTHALDGASITGTLPVAKGGTGVTTLETLAANISASVAETKTYLGVS